jgi:hypothetical protein
MIAIHCNSTSNHQFAGLYCTIQAQRPDSKSNFFSKKTLKESVFISEIPSGTKAPCSVGSCVPGLKPRHTNRAFQNIDLSGGFLKLAAAQVGWRIQIVFASSTCF